MADISVEEKYKKAYIDILPSPFKMEDIKIDYNDFEDIYVKNIAIDVVTKVKNSNDYTNHMPDCTLIHNDFNRIIFKAKNHKLVKCLITFMELLIKDSNKIILKYDSFKDIVNKEEYKSIIKNFINKNLIYPTNQNDIFVINHNLIYKGSLDLFLVAYHYLYLRKPDGIVDLIDNKVHLYENLNYYE